MNRKKICFLTGSRADYGIIKGLMKAVNDDNVLLLQLLVTGMHLSRKFGYTLHEIEQDGFSVDEKVETLLDSDSDISICKSLALGVIGIAEALTRLRPDLLIVLGDRYEILAGVQAALICKIPVAHIAGGDMTIGAYDESIRHAITKMSHLHFATNELSARRIVMMGENPDNVYVVGSPAIDAIKELVLLDKNDLFKELGLDYNDRFFLITFHHETLSKIKAKQQIYEVLSALANYPYYTKIFTLPNADSMGGEVVEAIDQFVSQNNKSIAYKSLGQLRYFSLLQYVDVVIGNSSSGLYEVPSFKKPTVNIGNRQSGRLFADSVINCECKCSLITEAIDKALLSDCTNTKNPYGEGCAVKKTIEVFKQFDDFSILLNKAFFM